MRLITGFPGFLGTGFLSRILLRSEISALVLVQKKFEALARLEIDRLNATIPGAGGRITLASGDLTESGLGITGHPLLDKITEVDHFAAVYDLSVGEPLARKINIEGTRNVLDLAKSLPSFRSLHYVSTCYVSGTHPGRFLESDLDKGQQFHNFYESTKYEAEVLVRDAMRNGLPAAIYRPAIVVGDSKTGETRKFDGPYFVLQWLLRQGRRALLPRIGDATAHTLNIVPGDFVLDAMAHLALKPASTGNTFQLADPAPLTIAELVRTLARDCERELIEIPLSKGFTKFALGSIPGLERFVGIPASAIDYFTHPASYDTGTTLRHLEGSGIACPPFASYSKKLVEFMKSHPGIRSNAMI